MTTSRLELRRIQVANEIIVDTRSLYDQQAQRRKYSTDNEPITYRQAATKTVTAFFYNSRQVIEDHRKP